MWPPAGRAGCAGCLNPAGGLSCDGSFNACRAGAPPSLPDRPGTYAVGVALRHHLFRSHTEQQRIEKLLRDDLTVGCGHWPRWGMRSVGASVPHEAGGSVAAAIEALGTGVALAAARTTFPSPSRSPRTVTKRSPTRLEHLAIQVSMADFATRWRGMPQPLARYSRTHPGSPAPQRARTDTGGECWVAGEMRARKCGRRVEGEVQPPRRGAGAKAGAGELGA